MARKQAKPGCFLTEQLLHGSALRHCCPFGPVASVASISTLSKKKKKKKTKKKTFFSPSTLVLNTFTLLSRPLLSLLFLPKPQRTELDLKGGGCNSCPRLLPISSPIFLCSFSIACLGHRPCTRTLLRRSLCLPRRESLVQPFVCALVEGQRSCYACACSARASLSLERLLTLSLVSFNRSCVLSSKHTRHPRSIRSFVQRDYVESLTNTNSKKEGRVVTRASLLFYIHHR